MFRSKRAWIGLAVVLTLIIGCSAIAAPQVVKISFWHGETQPVRVQAMQALIDKFQKENPNIQVTQATCPNQDMFPKMIAALSTNTAPDMGSVVPDRAMAYQKNGYGQSVDSLVKKIDKQYTYITKQKSAYFFNNHYWAVPMWTITVMLFYREDLLKQAGFNAPPKTWDELMAAAKALTGNGKYGIALPASSGQNCTEQVVWSFMSTNKAQVYDKNGKIVFNNPKSVETIKYLTELSKYSPADATGWSWAETKLAFTSGKAAMGFVFGSVLLDLVQQTDFADSVKAVTIPIPAGGEPGGLTSTEGMMIFTKDKAKRAACEKFLEFFHEPENYGLTLANMQPGLYLPITASGMKSKAYFNNPVIKRFDKVIDAEFTQVGTGSLPGFEYPKRNPFVGEIGVSYILGETLQRAVSKQMTPEQAVEWGYNKMMSFK